MRGKYIKYNLSTANAPSQYRSEIDLRESKLGFPGRAFTHPLKQYFYGFKLGKVVKLDE